MKREKNRKVFYVIFVGVLLILACVLCLENKFIWFGENTNNISTSEIALDEDGYLVLPGTKRVETVEISNVRVKLIEPNKSEILADVRNTSNEFIEPTNLEIKILLNDGNEKTIGGIIPALEGQEEGVFLTYILKDITSIKSIKFKKIAN